MGKDGKTKFAAAGTFRYIVNTYPNWPLVRWSYSVEDGQAFIELIGGGKLHDSISIFLRRAFRVAVLYHRYCNLYL